MSYTLLFLEMVLFTIKLRMRDPFMNVGPFDDDPDFFFEIKEAEGDLYPHLNETERDNDLNELGKVYQLSLFDL